MTLYKSAADEIAELMDKELNKEAYYMVSFETFKKVVESATTCQDLEKPKVWYETGRLTENRPVAFRLLQKRQKELC